MSLSNEGKLPNILITGTPGVGKTSFSMLLTDSLNEMYSYTGKQFVYVNIGKLINEKKLYTEWNQEFDVPEFDDEKVIQELQPMINEGGCILDFHTADFIPEEWVNLVVLIRCDNTILYDRLKARGYSDKKIKENIECEIMEVTSEEVREAFPEEKIVELRGEQVQDMTKNLDCVNSILQSLINNIK
jgi:adenylate kinase